MSKMRIGDVCRLDTGMPGRYLTSLGNYGLGIGSRGDLVLGVAVSAIGGEDGFPLPTDRQMLSWLLERGSDEAIAEVLRPPQASLDPVAEWICWLLLSHFDGEDDDGFGVSAGNAVMMAFGAEDNRFRPSDYGDWRRCVRVRDSAPEPYRSAIAQILERWRGELLDRLRRDAANSAAPRWYRDQAALVDSTP